MSSDHTLLFVYGTLLSGAAGRMGAAQRERLARLAKVVGRATVPGRLFDFGAYPGMHFGGSKGELVHGEVLELASPCERTLAWLDAYEGIVPGQHPHNDYERRIVEVTLESGGVVQAWAYVYLKQPGEAPRVQGGNWLER